jgi:hypothetical protein
MARCSQLIDLGTSLTVDALLMPYALGEQTHAIEHLPHLPDNSVTLYDRGYFSTFLCFCHRHHQRDFVMRMPRRKLKAVDELFANPAAPKKIVLHASADCRKLAAEAAANGTVIPTDPMTLRLVRLTLSTGETEVLITSLLDNQRYPDADFKDLYAKRWGVETDFRSLKSRLQLENFTGRKPLSVEQDFHAKIVTKNLVQLLVALQQEALDRQRQTAVAQNLPHPRHRARINLVDALHLAKFTIVRAIVSGSAHVVQKFMSDIRRHQHCERPGRSTPRRPSRSKVPRYPIAYKQTA